MSKNKERFKAILTEAAELYFMAEAQQNPTPSGDFGDEIEAIVTFQTAANEFIEIVENQIDCSWRALSGKKRFDSEKMRLHEVFVASFGRFKAAFEQIEDMENCLRDHTNEHS